MNKTVWIVSLPDGSKSLVKTGQKVLSGDILAEKGNREIKSPVQGQVKEIEENKIHLEFKSKKVSGQGLNNKNNWGEIKWQPKINYGQLSVDYQGQIIVLGAEELTSYFISKAQTLGIRGLIVFGGRPNLEKTSIPILIVDKPKAKLIKKIDGVKCLLDASSDCLLIPERAEG